MEADGGSSVHLSSTQSWAQPSLEICPEVEGKEEYGASSKACLFVKIVAPWDGSVLVTSICGKILWEPYLPE